MLNISSQAFSERGIFIFPALLLSVLPSPVGQTCLLVLQLSKSSMCGCSIEPSGPTRKKFSSFVLLLVFGMGEGVGVKSRAGPCVEVQVEFSVEESNSVTGSHPESFHHEKQQEQF